MKTSAKTEYACLAMMELAARYQAGKPIRIRTIAQEHGIPSRFLVQILLQLKTAGLVLSTRGAAGGYQLAQDPAEISLGTVMAIIEGRQSRLTRDSGSASPAVRVLRSVWGEMMDVERRTLDGITLFDLAERLRNNDDNMYFI